jgi:hypothetical protein
MRFDRPDPATDEEMISLCRSLLCDLTGEDLDPSLTFGFLRQRLKGLLNQWNAGPPSSSFLQRQDRLLWTERLKAGIVNTHELPTVNQTFGYCGPFADMLVVWQGDITRLDADAIVNAANSQLLGCFQPMHNCIDNVIHSAAGLQLREDCRIIMRLQGHPENTGEAKITRAYNLPSRSVEECTDTSAPS